jgi:hypothetical protein
MKAFLEFDMADPGDREQHQDMLNAQRTLSAIRDFDNHLRAIIKYGDGEYTDEQIDHTNNIRQVLHSQLEIHGVEIW